MRGEEKNSPLPFIDDPWTHLFNYNYLTNLNLCEPLFTYMSINQSKSCVPTYMLTGQKSYTTIIS